MHAPGKPDWQMPGEGKTTWQPKGVENSFHLQPGDDQGRSFATALGTSFTPQAIRFVFSLPLTIAQN